MSAAQDLESVSDTHFTMTNREENIWECQAPFDDVVLRILCFPHKAELVILWAGVLVSFRGLLEEQEERAIRYKNDFLLRTGNPWEMSKTT